MLISCAVGLAFLKLQATEIRVENVRPSRVLPLLKDALPLGNSVKADDSRSLLLVTAEQDVVDEVRTYVRLFDVRPVRLEMKVTIKSEIDHAEFETTAKVANNSAWRVADEATDVDLTLRPHVNDDATVTVTVITVRGKTKSQIVARAANNRPLRLELDDKGTILGFFTDEERPRSGLKHPVIIIRPNILDSAGAAKNSKLP